MIEPLNIRINLFPLDRIGEVFDKLHGSKEVLHRFALGILLLGLLGLELGFLSFIISSIDEIG